MTYTFISILKLLILTQPIGYKQININTGGKKLRYIISVTTGC